MSGLSKFMNLLGFGKQEMEEEEAVVNNEPVSVYTVVEPDVESTAESTIETTNVSKEVTVETNDELKPESKEETVSNEQQETPTEKTAGSQWITKNAITAADASRSAPPMLGIR